MSLPKTLADFTGSSWKTAKKQAGVKGAGFFESSSGKAIAAKIDDYQDKVATLTAKKNQPSADALLKAIKTLMVAFETAKKDRTFTTEVAKEFKSGIEHLVAELRSEATAVTLKSHALAELAKVTKMEDVLKSPILKARLRPFLKKRLAIEGLDFLEAVAKRTDPAILLTRFVQENATDQVNLSVDQREAAENGNFRPAIQEVVAVLHDDQFVAFMTHERQNLF